MNTKLTSRTICVIAFGGWSALASALSLGPLTGTATVGRPLDLVAPIHLDDLPQAYGSGCVTAQVLYGDKAIDQAQVNVGLRADAARQVSYASIATLLPVDEPFVTVVLNAGCGRPYSRRYVLLANAPTQEPMLLASASSLAVAGPIPLATGTAVAVRSSRNSRTASTRVAGAAPRVDNQAPVRGAAAARDNTPRPVSRLQLAVWDPVNEQLPWLRASTELKSSPTADAARRATATSLWRALNAQPQDLLRTAERLRGLEGEVSSLRTLSARHRAEIASARESLQNTRQRDHTSLVVVTLFALLLGSAAAWIWHRSRRPSQADVADSWYGPLAPWSDPAAQDERPAVVIAAAPAARTASVVPPAPVSAQLRPEAPPLALPPAPAKAAAPMLPELTFAVAEAPPAATLAVAAPETSGLKLEALQAAQQQSEFFASLGQVDEAVAVLTSYLDDSRERPPLAYLELFRIYHGMGMRTEYDALRATFREVFGTDAASFNDYTDEPRELDMYLLPVTRIASAWPSERSLEIIEDLLFKRPATPRDLLSLEAYRDLVWLYALGQDVVHNTAMPAGLQLQGDWGLPNDHFILPWADGEQREPTELSLDRLDNIDVAPELSSFAVDIDLTAIRGDLHPGSAAVHPGAPPPTQPVLPNAELDAFDAAMESQSRRMR